MLKKKIFLITCSYGEYSDSQTIRLRNMIHSLNSTHFDIELIVPGPSTKNSLILHPYQKVHFFQEPIIFRFLSFLNKSNFILKDKVYWFFKNFFYRFSFPDMFMFWFPKMSTLGDGFVNSGNIVISASGSPVAHIVAYKLTSKFNLKWIADFGDPWYSIDKKLRPFFAPLTYLVEKKILSKTSALIFTTESTRAEYKKLYKITDAKSVVIPYGVLNSDISLTSTLNLDKVRTEQDVFLFSHIGAAFKNDRNLIPMINALDSLIKQKQNSNQLGFVIAGNHSSDFDLELDKTSLSYKKKFGRISLEESIKFLHLSNVNVIIGNKNGAQVPGKIFMCLSIPRPILYIFQCHESFDEARVYLGPCPGIIYCLNEINEIKTAIKYIEENYSQLHLDSINRINSEFVKKFEGVSLSNLLVQTINTL